MLSNYNALIRPVQKPTDYIKLHLGLKLSQIADIVCIYKIDIFVFIIKIIIYYYYVG
jgi:hypothetical protein